MFHQYAVRNHPTGVNLPQLAQSRLLWCFVVVALIIARHLYTNGGDFIGSSGGTDDATRLIQVRSFWMSGAWYDMTLAQIGAPDALQSHWSRLIDLPLGMMIWLVSLFTGHEGAVTTVRVFWPAMLLLALTYIVVRDVDRRAGAVAVAAVLFLIFSSVFATFQFHPGRLDHHNVQILSAIAGVLLLQRSLSEAWYGFPAGALIGLGFVIGLEALLPVAAIMAVALTIAGFVPQMRQGVRRALRSCTGMLLVGFLLATPPSQWTAVECDALSLNLLMLFGVGTATMTVLKLWLPNATAMQWFGSLAAGGVAGLGLYVALEPVCVGGPFAKIDPVAWTVWASKVNEAMSVAKFADVAPTGVLSFIVILAVGIAIQAANLYRDRDAAALFAFAAIVIMAIYSCLYVRLIPYAIWLALPAIAVWIAQLPAIGSLSQPAVRVGAALVLSQTTLVAILGPMLALFGGSDANAVEKMTSLTKVCSRDATIGALSALPDGLVANEIDLGPYIALHTRHRVLAAPYHRIDKSIVAADRVFNSAPGESEAVLRRLGATYVVACKRTGGRLAKVEAGTVMHALQHGQPVPFLEAVATDKPTSPLLVFRVKPQGR